MISKSMDRPIRRAAVLLLFGLAIVAASPTARAQFVTCTGGNGGAACLVPGSCQTGTCSGTTCAGNGGTAANGTSCNDGNACTQNDVCQSGTCVGGNPVVCTALDQCHTAGTCNSANGVCSNPARPNGTACNDGNACTQNDVCQAGTCVGGNPVVCTASDQCHTAGTCNSANGVCSNPVRPDGTACNDGNACTQNDVCQSGTCVGGNAVVCTALDQCHAVGTCNPANGVCSNPSAPNGTACDDGNPRTVDDVCTAGVCSGAEFHIIEATVSGSTFSVTFSTAAGRHYSLEGSPDLANWTPINGSAFTGDGNPHISTADVTGNPTRYFVRVLVAP